MSQPRSRIGFLVENLIGAVRVGFFLLTAPVSRRWYNTWGATPEEARRALPGDDRVPHPRLAYTRAVTIHAPAAAIWPWLVQIGQGRGGLYSYDGLENLVGCDIHSADRILPEFQSLKMGDYIRFGPAEKKFPGQVVMAIEPQRAIVMCGLDPQTGQAQPGVTWTLFLDERGDGTTRLIARGRNDYGSSRGASILWRVVEPINFVMERQMMLTIRRHVEAVRR